MTDLNRKTGLSIKQGPTIVNWLLKNCTTDEIFFMASLHSHRNEFKLLTSIITRLADYNIYTTFYAQVKDEKELMVLRSGKLGEVAGLKAFALACQLASDQIAKRQKENKSERSEE